MIETLMAQLYYRGRRRRVEDLKAQGPASSPKQIYLVWYDTGDHSDPFMVFGPGGTQWNRGDPGPPPGHDILPDGGPPEAAVPAPCRQPHNRGVFGETIDIPHGTLHNGNPSITTSHSTQNRRNDELQRIT